MDASGAQRTTTPSWHTLSAADLERELGTNLDQGLTSHEAIVRLREHGANVLPTPKTEGSIVIFFRQFQSPLIYILFLASVIVFFTQDFLDSIIILAVLVFNAILGTVQEGKANQTLLALRRFTKTSATVLRDGEETVLPDEEVVPGDCIVLREGEKIPADARIIESNNLKVAEAALTGESVPVHKSDIVLQQRELPTAERTNMVFKGTAVVGGSGKAVVVETGARTVIGRISETIAAIETEIPLKRDIRSFSKLVVGVVAFLCTLTFFLGIWFGKPVDEMFRTAVSLAVSIIPEGLPVVLTLILATGVWRMAKRNALVKKLHAVEALGQAKIIAVDKTGTLTRNEMVIRKVFADGKLFEIGGNGYESRGEVRLDNAVVDPPNHPELIFVGQIAAFGANARVSLVRGESGAQRWQVVGDPTEAAMLVLSQKLGFHKEELERESPLLAEIPFDYRLKYHATSHFRNEKAFTVVAGAPEIVLDLSSRVWSATGVRTMSAEDRNILEDVYQKLSSEGLRIVALGVREDAPRKESEIIETQNLAFAAFVGMQDALRPEVPDAVRRVKGAGMRLVMITGDHRLTAIRIAQEAGIWNDGDEAITDEELSRWDDAELVRKLPRATVFARITPEHKMRIIDAFKRRGEVVAMTGDGVNDAPSLVAADLGVAMGITGSEVAREAADIVLLDDNFGTIVSAIEEGRNMFSTIQKSVLFLFSTSLGELLCIVGAIILGLPLPILPAQILWLNLVTDPFIGSALAVDPKEPNLIRAQFKKPSRFIVDGLMLVRIIVMAVPMMLGTLYLFATIYPENPAKALTISLTVLAIFQWFNGWNCRSKDRSVFTTNPFENPLFIISLLAVIGLQMLAIYAPLMQNILHTVPLTAAEWGTTTFVAFSIVLAEEVRKAMYRFFRPRKRSDTVTPKQSLTAALQ